LYPKEYIQYLVHFHGDQDYFECHEILEEFWKKSDFKNKHSIWVGFIQLAVANYHHRRENFAGAKKTLKKAFNIFLTMEDSITKLGLEYHTLIATLTEQLAKIEQKHVFNSFQLPIYDDSLLNECKIICKQEGFMWGNDNNITDEHLVHRHKLRDRTKIIQQRQHALKNRKNSK
jgi:uncharacterized protein